MIVKNVTTSDQPMPQPSFTWNQAKAAGLVPTAIAVAIRVSRRHCSPSSDEADVRSRSPGSTWLLAIYKG